MPAVDARVLSVNIEGRTFTNHAISCRGTVATGGIVNNATVRIHNVERSVRDSMLLDISPFAGGRQRQISLEISAGRMSGTVYPIFRGDVHKVSVTQPPDIALEISAQTGYYNRGILGAGSAEKEADYQRICQATADANSLNLEFAGDNSTKVQSYYYAGSRDEAIQALYNLGGHDVYQDNDTLVVKRSGEPRRGAAVSFSSTSGMIGVPELTELGVRIRVLYTNELAPGNLMSVSSSLNPAASGSYEMYKITFDLTNREQAWYAVIEGRRL